MPRNELPEQPLSPPCDPQTLQGAIYESKISHYRDHLAETMAALEHIGEAQSSINYVDAGRRFIDPDDMGRLWEIRGKLRKLRQHLRDELELRGENPDEE